MMKFLRKIFRRDNRMHKRPFLTAITVFVIFFLAAVALFVSLGILRMSSDYPKVAAKDEISGVVSSGMGVNLSYLPSTNLVWDPSFENNTAEDVYSVAEAKGDSVYLHNKADDELLPGSFAGGKLRILSYDEEGQLKQVVNAGILDYQTEQLGIWRPVDSAEQGDLYASKIRSSGSETMVLLQTGEIISDVTSDAERTVPEDGDGTFADVSVSGSHYFAVTNTGAFYFSSNGKTWEKISDGNEEAGEINALTILGKMGIACGNGGRIIVCDTNSVVTPSVSSESDLLTSCSDGKRVLIGGSDGYVCTTVNGTLFRQLTSEEIPVSAEDVWVLSDYSEEEFVLIDRTGKVAIGTYNEKSGKYAFKRSEAVLPNGLQPTQLSVFAGGDIWVLTDNGFIYAFSRSQDKWHQIFGEKDNMIDAICRSSGDSILISRDGNLYSASMYTRVTIDHSIGDVEIQNGDMCILSSQVPSVSSTGSGAWEVFGSDTTVRIVSDTPKLAGDKSVMISSTLAEPSEAHFISQVISRDEINPMKEKVFYHARLWLKQTNLEKEEVLVWISGLSEPIGTTFTSVSGNWKEYTFTFAWPAEKMKQDDMEIRLNIGFYGSGDMYADAVRLQREAYSEQSIRSQVVDAVADSEPEFLRLENLALGRLGRTISENLPMIGNEHITTDKSGNVTDTGVISLESTLRLVKQVNAKPWLVIDSAFSSEEMETLLGYIAGGITDTYGKLRVDNGTAVPWNKQFEKIVVEFSDNDGLFETDLQRRAYVDYMISLIVTSKYYPDLRDKLFFVDGMTYESGTMTSAADYHVSTLDISNSGADRSADASVSDIGTLIDRAYSDYIDSIPRNASYIQDTTGEWIGNLSFSVVRSRVSENQIVHDETSLSSADIVEFLLKDLGDHTSMVVLNLPVSRTCGDAGDEYLFSDDGDTLENRRVKSANMETLMRICGIMNTAAQGQRVETVWTAPLKHKKDDNYTIGLRSYAYSADGYVYLIVTNPTKEQQQFLIESHTSIKNVSVTRYSVEGEQIALASTKNFLNGNERRYTLQPGQIIVAKIPV